MLSKDSGCDPNLFEDTWAEDFQQYTILYICLPTKDMIIVKDPSLDQLSLDTFQNENKTHLAKMRDTRSYLLQPKIIIRGSNCNVQSLYHQYSKGLGLMVEDQGRRAISSMLLHTGNSS